MRTFPVSITMTTLLTAGALADSVRFADTDLGQAPSGWTATQTGRGAPKWTVEKDDTAPSKSNVL